MSVLAPLRSLLGADVIQLPGEFDAAPRLHDQCTAAPPEARLLGLARPRSTEAVSQILKFCNANDIKVAPQGGMTGLVGGGVPIGPALALSLELMRAIEEVDPAAGAITAQAGATLEAVQVAADEAGMFFPLDIGGRGTAQIGGNASTNAGGNRVVRYGMMRALVLGMECVLADGAIVSSLNKMIKNNAGYDLKHLFIGSEGTLGVITRLVLRCMPKARSLCTALCAVKDYHGVLELLAAARSGLGATLSSFEMMEADFYRLAIKARGRPAPLAPTHGCYVLIETMGDDEGSDQARCAAVIGEAIDAGVVQDAVIAKSGAEVRELWAVRESTLDFPKPNIGFDISIPPGQMGDYTAHVKAMIEARWPGTLAVFFGHVADSNLHLAIKSNADPAWEQAVEALVYATIGEWKGSVSAEHGIGAHKKPFLQYSRTPEEVELMRTLKRALDPKGILNPGKVF
ncbi:MAG TPA: FAD-binding oxidoreductase [Phenylobacterium sp.]|uniref:FAD-binding oxidoreductase n=1 Tax=Phenylobacterium sp. TaxID=1871053 RepID=UPI002B48F337|nr:FAD-binding oxidoreductase [Phenylobacterium sp.]HKR90364.1 FAD-binding oxidoreductase [Phenylobacterium sp.]